ncbi:hypothetical protein CEXT_196131 [Caerostris extrusa]|uniref:Uncharacterized protein n=1 Tax=Caerostris extrusa TaxID=172846 RepID=A0AAV4XE65_CAEEX|nr:hypothetical protein CEXT_196131 [Caerostris extrusa]
MEGISMFKSYHRSRDVPYQACETIVDEDSFSRQTNSRRNTISTVQWRTSKGIYQSKQIYQVILNEFRELNSQWPLNHSPCMRYQRQSKPTVDTRNVMRYAPCFKMSGCEQIS